MADIYSDIGAKQSDPTPSNMAKNSELFPRTCILNPTQTMVGNETTSSRMKLVYVPKGTKVFAKRSLVRTSAAVAATAFVVNVGYLQDDETVDADKFATAVNINGGANEYAFDEPVMYEFTDAGWITCTPSTVTGAVTAGVTLAFEITVTYPN